MTLSATSSTFNPEVAGPVEAVSFSVAATEGWLAAVVADGTRHGLDGNDLALLHGTTPAAAVSATAERATPPDGLPRLTAKGCRAT